MIDLDKLFGIARPVILVNVFGLEFVWPDNLLEQWSQSIEIAPP
jgi:hypothetical protein